MIEMVKVFLDWFSALLDAFLSSGHIVAIAIVCVPLFFWVVGALRSIISRK